MILLFNKPFKVLSQFTTDSDKKTLADYIDVNNVYAAGRLDYDSEGLLLLTDDGKLQQNIANPKHKKEKEYWVQVEGIPEDSDLQKLRDGVKLKDGMTKPAKTEAMDSPDLWERDPPVRYRKQIPTSWIKIIISEGRNRQVRRMTASIGFPTLRLVRVRIDNWVLDGLAPGQYQLND